MTSQENADLTGSLEQARAAYLASEWRAAYTAFKELDDRGALPPGDIEVLAMVSFMLGNVGEMLGAQERAFHAYMGEGQKLPAARVALWTASNLASRGKFADASGWVERGQRLLESTAEPSVAHGYLLMPQALRHVMSHELEQVVSVAAEAAAIGRQFMDRNLEALAAQTQARALLHLGQTATAFRLLDEVMLSVRAGDCSPMVTGLVYCAVLEGCYEAHEVRRAADWTDLLVEWCGCQPDLVAFTDQCLAHRSEILRLQGEWNSALTAAQRSHENVARGSVAAQAHYQQAEVYRLRGEFGLAEQAFEQVALKGGEPQPGLACLRLSQGNEDAAVASIRRALLESTDLLDRVRLLPGFVRVMVETGYLDDASRAIGELAAIAEQTRIEVHLGWAAQAAGVLFLALSKPVEAASSLRKAMEIWQEVGMPYELALTRKHLGQALLVMGDEEGAQIQLQAAKGGFVALGATPDALAVDWLSAPDVQPRPFGLTEREVEVLAKLASGATNRAIAEDLVLSERTIDRHVSNIFTKLGVSTRSAATAQAIRNDVV